MKLMKQALIVGLMGVVLVSGVRAEEATEEAPAKRIGIVNVGGFDEPLFGRVTGHLATELLTTPQVLAPQDVVGSGELVDEADALAKLVVDPLVCVVGVAKISGVEGHGVMAIEKKTAVVNATALAPEDGDEEVYARRLEKAVISAVGRLTGMKYCPNPRCALHAYQTMKQLDEKGRNYCPPCQVKFKKLRDEGGLDQRERPEPAPPPPPAAPTALETN